MHKLYADMQVSFFERMSMRAREAGAINLGQGFPDGSGPPALLKAAADALTERSNQYPPMLGLPELRGAVADHYRAAQGLDLSAEEVVITSGATEAIAATIMA
ncbi:MAG TPA: aminotransferase class I/II-fold pyridoxal phosphate-dependent enzyme, partial [Allosphingosinicella sp.]